MIGIDILQEIVGLLKKVSDFEDDHKLNNFINLILNDGDLIPFYEEVSKGDYELHFDYENGNSVYAQVNIYVRDLRYVMDLLNESEDIYLIHCYKKEYIAFGGYEKRRRLYERLK